MIGFDVTRTQALLRCVPAHKQALGRLMSRFPSGRMVDQLAASVPIDGFVAGIAALGGWPDPDGVTWEPDFQALITDLLDSADDVENLLAGAPPGEQVDPADVRGMLGPDWTGDLTKFQERDIARLLSMKHGANFSVPGAGKTRVSLAAFAALREQGRVSRMLVVCPKSAYQAWAEEAQVCFRRPLVVEVLNRKPSVRADIIVVNYERLDKSLGALSDWLKAEPAILTLDEAHRMKLGGAGVYGAACMALGPLSRVRMILSGTPAPNGAKDLENLLSFVWPGYGRRVVTQAVNGGDLAYASSVLRPLYARTTKHELGLPPAQTRIRKLAMPPLHREIYRALIGDPSARAVPDGKEFEALGRAVLRLLMAATSPALLVEGSSPYEPLSFQVPPLKIAEDSPLWPLFRRLPEHEVPPKYHETLSIIDANAKAGRKTLVWASFVRSIATLQTLLAPYQPAMVHGGTPNREEEIQRFREDPECMVLVSNPATLGEGISLHHVCHDAVFVDRDFQAGRYLQSLDRIHRLGLAPDAQTNITVLVSEGTVDEIVTERLADKLTFMGEILDDPSVKQLADPEEEPSSLAAGMDQQDVQALLAHLGRPPR
ncbi:DEAD/DEAH box helicase [Kribbella hippodromi]|uniref:DEAD/DEAH box helicase n=1 Tax=Kribbella hippodromi TaxID=434347 RepID=UPI0031DE3D4D